MKNNRSLAFAASILALMGITKALARPSQADSNRPLVLKTVEYGLDIKFDFEAEKLLSECRLTVLNPSAAPIGRIPLILYRLLKATSVTDETGAALAFTQRIEACDDWDRLQLDFIEVSLARPIPAGGRETLVVKYEGYLAGYADTGMLYVKDQVRKEFTIIRPDCLAYPQIGIPSWEANRAGGLPSFDYLLKVTVPDSLVVANGGRLVDVVSKDGLTTYSYRNIKPAWRIDAAIAPYKITEDKSQNLKVFCFSEDSEGATTVLQSAKEAKVLFSGWFGQLKDDRGFAIIEIPDGYGSQKDVTSILQTRGAFKDRAQLPQLYHEVSHFWDTRPLDPAPSRVESEGMAMLLQFAAKQKLEGDSGAIDRGAEKLRESFREDCRSNSKAADVPAIDYGKAGLTDLSYSKGMIFFYILYQGAGEKAFMDAIGRCHAKFRDTGAFTKDFLDSLAGFLKKDLTRFYGDWIYGASSSRALLGDKPLADIIKSYF